MIPLTSEEEDLITRCVRTCYEIDQVSMRTLAHGPDKELEKLYFKLIESKGKQE